MRNLRGPGSPVQGSVGILSGGARGDPALDDLVARLRDHHVDCKPHQGSVGRVGCPVMQQADCKLSHMCWGAAAGEQMAAAVQLQTTGTHQAGSDEML